jgi:hypothetical protein
MKQSNIFLILSKKYTNIVFWDHFVIKHLKCNTLQIKANLESEHLEKVLEWLSNAPRWTTIRLNRNLISKEDGIQSIRNFLQKVLIF